MAQLHPSSCPKPTAIISIAIAAICTCATGLFPINSLAAEAVAKRGEPITLNFANAEIDSVARTMATITGRNVVVDPRVKGVMTLSTERAVTPAVAYSQFLAALRLQGFTVVQTDGLDKIVPEADAKLQPGPVTQSDSNTVVGNQIVTQIFKLNYENAANLVPVLRPLISPNNTINLNPGNNSLVVTDYADNLRRLGRIIAAMDVSNASDVEIIPLKNALAVDLVPLVIKLVESGSSTSTAAPAAGGQTDNAFKTTLIAEPRSNAVILRAANPARVSLVKSLISKLDQPASNRSNGDAGNIYVVYLKNADATKLATTLRAAMSANTSGGSSSSSSGGSSSGSLLSSSSSGLSSSSTSSTTSSASSSGPTLNSANSNQPSTGGQIQADPTTNSLIITAPEPQYRQLRAVIDKLDSRRAQVLVESLIVEVSSDKSAEFGIQWQGALGNVGLGTNFGSGSSNLATLATNIATGSTSTTLSKGFNLGVAAKVGGTYVLGALARLMDETGTGNVLSTPNLLTLDNEEAKIVVGQNVPFVTGTYTTSSTSTSTPFQTIERKDVGLTLRVRPQINENGTVKMVIYQEVSSVDASTKSNTNGPTTNKRSIESTVIVDDGSVVVLGGLLQDTYAGSVEKVPGLGDLPVLGNFFKSETRSRQKTNLMVFLRPIVVRDGSTSDALTLDRYDMMRGQQQGMKPSAHPMLSGIADASELPALPISASDSKASVPKPLTTPPVPVVTTTAP